VCDSIVSHSQGAPGSFLPRPGGGLERAQGEAVRAPSSFVPLRAFVLVAVVGSVALLGPALGACGYDWTTPPERSEGGARDDGGVGAEGGAPGERVVCSSPLEPCDAGCPSTAASPCSLTCNGGTSCTGTCARGGCTFVCGSGAACDFSCSGGGCTVECATGSSCKAACSGGGCTFRCGLGACETSCSGGGCTPSSL
jgi:hypothetical protein